MNEVVIPLKITGIAQIKAELRSLKDQMVSATDPAQISALADQAGELTKKLEQVNSRIGEFKKGSNLDQAKAQFTSLGESISSLDFAGAAKHSEDLNQSIKSISPADLGKQFKGLISTVGNVAKSFVSLGVTLLANPIFLIVAAVVAIIAVVALVLKSFGKLDDVIKALMGPVNAIIAGFKSMTDWLGLTSFAAEENAEKTAAANKKVSESSKLREAQVVGDLGREIAQIKAAGEDASKLEEAVSNTKIKEANLRKAAAKKEQDDIKTLDGKFYDDKRIELKKQVDAENEIIKQANSDKVVAKNTANKKELDALAVTDKESADKQKAANDKYAAADKASMEQIAAARKIVTDSAKTAQQIELDDLKAAYVIKIAEATKYKNDTTALLDAQKIQESVINKKYADAAKATEATQNAAKATAMASSHAANIAKIDAYNAALSELTDTEEQKLYDKYAADLITFEGNELALFNLKKKYEEDTTALKKTEADKQKAITDKARADEMAAIKGGLDTATDALNSINSLTSIGMEAKLKGVKKGSKEEEKILRAQFKQQKAMQLAMAAINGAQAILAILAVPDFTLGVASGIRIAASVAATAASIATISSTQFGGGATAPTTPDVSGGGEGASTTAVAPAAGPNLFGQANTGSQVNAGGGTNNITVTAIVSETEITASQNNISNIQQNSVL